MQTIYLAGPGVFRPDAHNWGLQLQQACQQFGLRGLYPLDQAAPANLSPAKTAAWIFAANCALIRQADAVFADVRAFRSISEPDSGTAFEIGFAHALGKPILLWLPDVPANITMLDRVGQRHDLAGWSVEDFDAPLNLMLWHSASHVIYHTEVLSAIESAANYLNNSTT
ncbi:nucleoside 2-deoxyribosyltransferase [Chitinibacter fontanus]|uniref:Nucleoside 2-deoxyribosyltransferase n=1 Tax=Chitinibacter fontanus TaxID=1737446 RepID=A0A7D5V9Q8_9NEIS|nr:nucleoside 2-deoxyribosyltransferase [Chitinibacter fontanus]QLI81454.1 nucleoside 2-deoxyribosyltransferase [Chitinibacter fontanus]